jgi:hypothetical protein
MGDWLRLVRVPWLVIGLLAGALLMPEPGTIEDLPDHLVIYCASGLDIGLIVNYLVNRNEVT